MMSFRFIRTVAVRPATARTTTTLLRLYKPATAAAAVVSNNTIPSSSLRDNILSTRHTSTTPIETRPFRILGLQQIAVGSLEKKSMSSIWQDILGLDKIGTHRSEKENVDEDILRLGTKGSDFVVEVDLMSPIDPERSPKVHSPALNHIGLWVDDLETAVSWMKEKGVRFTPGGIRKGAAGHDVTFIHPKGNETSPIGGAGVLIELVQAPPRIVDAFTTKE